MEDLGLAERGSPNPRRNTSIRKFVFRGEETRRILLCESLIDALTFWCPDYRNVTASYLSLQPLDLLLLCLLRARVQPSR
jgi:hypothetical protein